MNFKDIAGKLIGNGLPVIGNLLGGSLGEKAGEIAASVLGCEPTPEAIDQAIQDPEKLIQLKKYEMDHKVELEKLQLQEAGIYIKDVQNARQREVNITQATGKRDIHMVILAWVIVSGFFVLLGFLAFKGIPEINRDLMNLAVGALLGCFSTVVGYYFGSSKSSSDKNAIIATKAV
jgi:hypothetical protein